ncbi:MAG: peptidoglycan-associated lipoprotein Pal [Halorhodospira halophila]|uniref:peptidoglycan-associated lipoprotein Pal n=1 Tax=Halorhodospira TaxID=85108 RepID=UPI001EE86402|nr:MULTISPECIES: peptidoglycan-associated lipoprotein Pal [Halorhodospira]MCC3750766.1 peptidoglycan-associated lipoprotein Pal [Halorhodospira halophila]MCG5534171.1 peptidoglycan-associated lipoprotein Pal [Halorhodospira sp. 9621]MCG5539453.1 peptidoglycan-associated lipoprotein Pal [Halorhodospira sp. 9622]
MTARSHRNVALRPLRTLGLTASLALLAGCAHWIEDPETAPGEETELETEDFDPTEAEALEDPSDADEERLERARAEGLDPDDPLDAAVLDEPDSPLATRRVHFAFDSSDIRDEDIPVLEAHAEFLREHPDERMTIEGHTDERGSREYNLALGERRAEAVERLLRANGARSDQLEVVSYGEEDPLIDESNEDAWAENRRAELLYER